MMVYPTGRTTSMFMNMIYASPHFNGCFAPSPHTQNPLVQHFLRYEQSHSSISICLIVGCSPDDQLLNSKNPMWPVHCHPHKNEVWANGTSEQKTWGRSNFPPRDSRLQILYRKCGACSPVQHNASPDKNSRTTLMVSLP
ncbi:hypothetical protein TNCV_895571 [Trichonephila clavipes]|nr:hypothetical protein TNCV_895571 [Trichonephila clavipes]